MEAWTLLGGLTHEHEVQGAALTHEHEGGTAPHGHVGAAAEPEAEAG